ncbi:uncharacterized protein LOC126619864 isoform X1 [Malus sylvestris]|uniref:uncharacterized protein LOC126619864 isoform X1 n=1 Tax=Malus sylvestris TaxID=3752 RepID=UPI0021AD2B21|nr:uncharacterized protein LOC126619864 isoform X1 [Malus sylvestris]
MGCFPKCFSTCKRRNLKSSVTLTPFKHHSIEVAEEALQIQPAEAEPTKLEELIKAIKHSRESEEKSEEQSKNGDIKKVAFDLNVEANDEETHTKEELSNVLVECDEKENEGETRKGIEPNSIVSSVVSPSSHPLNQNHRYEKCKNSEVEDDDCANADEFESSKQIFVEEESSESLFSLSIDSRKQEVCDDSGTEGKEVNSPMPKQQNGRRDCRRQSFQAVLTPVENLGQWKEEVKEKSTPAEVPKQQHKEKENINMEVEEEQDLKLPFSPEPALKQSKLSARPRTKSSSCVDTSLSSWLVESETTPMSKASSNNSVGNKFKAPGSREDRPILGAWTAEKLKQLSASSTPKRSRSPSPEEMPIMGTVGSYWNRTGQALLAEEWPNQYGKTNR